MSDSTTPDLARARDLHRKLIALDGHLDVDLSVPAAGAAAPLPFDVAEARRGGLRAAVLTVHAGARRAGDTEAGRAELEQRYAAILACTGTGPQDAGVALSPAEVRELAGQDRFAVIIGFQNAAPLADDPDPIESITSWVERGVRIFAFAFIGNNAFAGSARPYPFVAGPTSFDGLSDLGVAAVRRLNQLGTVIDVAQLSDAAYRRVLEVSSAPVLSSHSAPRALLDADRNVTDEQMRALAEHGGVLQVVGFAPYLRPLADPVVTELAALWSRAGLAVPQQREQFLSINDPATADWADDRFYDFLHEYHDVLDLGHPTATTRDMVDALDHAVETMGIDHVGISSDFNHAGGLADWRGVGESLHVTAELLRRGYRDDDIARLWGENLLALWERVAAAG